MRWRGFRSDESQVSYKVLDTPVNINAIMIQIAPLLYGTARFKL